MKQVEEEGHLVLLSHPRQLMDLISHQFYAGAVTASISQMRRQRLRGETTPLGPQSQQVAEWGFEHSSDSKGLALSPRPLLSWKRTKLWVPWLGSPGRTGPSTSLLRKPTLRLPAEVLAPSWALLSQGPSNHLPHGSSCSFGLSGCLTPARNGPFHGLICIIPTIQCRLSFLL